MHPRNTVAARFTGCGLSSSLLQCRLPMCAQFLVEFRPALLREKDSGPLELYATASAWYRLCQPAGPFHIEIDIIGAPDDQRGCFQRLQSRFNRKGVLVIEGSEEALKIARALLGSNQRTEIGFDAVVAELFRMFICRSEGLRRPIDTFVRQHCVQGAS